MARPYAAAPALPAASTTSHQYREAEEVSTTTTQTYRDDDPATSMPLDPPPPGYAHICLQPVTRRTVVTTTTVTTLDFPPLRVPQVEVPLVLTDGERARLPISSRIGPSLSQRRADDDRLDPKLFPLARAQLPAGLTDVRFNVGNNQAVFAESRPRDKGKGRAETSSPRVRRQPPVASNIDDHRPSPRKRAKADHLSGAAKRTTLLPSPNLSPDALVPASFAPASPVSDIDTVLPYETTEGAAESYDVAALLSLPTLVDDFATLAPAVQSYILFNLLRRSSVPVLQSVSSIIEPALKRDFLVDLPPELVTAVLCCLDGLALCHASRVSRAWRQQIDGDGRAWLAAIKAEGLFIGEGTEDRDAARLSGKSAPTADEIFFKTWGSGLWKADFDQEAAAVPTAVKIAQAARDRRTRPMATFSSPAGPSMSPMSFSSPFNARVSQARQSNHPFRLLYRERFIRRRRWMTVAPTQTTFLSNTPSTVTCLQFDRKRIVSASDDLAINVYSMPTGRALKPLTGHEGGVWALQYLGNILVSGSTDRTVRVWDLDRMTNTHTFVGHTSTVRCLQILEPINVNPDPTGPAIWEPPYPLIVTGSRDWSLRTWRLPSPKRDASYSPPAPLSPGDGDSAIDVSNNPFHLRHFTGHKGAVRALAAHGRTVVSGSYDNTCRVWDALSGECDHVLEGHTGKVYSVVLDPAHRRCASGSMDGSVRLWSTATGECLRQLDGHSSLVGLLGLSGDRLISAAADATLRLWAPDTGECTSVLAAHTGAITCFQHDQHKVISGSDGTLKLWNVRTGAFVRDLLDGLSGVWQCAFDERYCVAAVQRNGRSEFDVLDFGDPADELPAPARRRGRVSQAGPTDREPATVGDGAAPAAPDQGDADEGEPPASSPIKPIGDPNEPEEPDDEEYQARMPEVYDDPVYHASPLARIASRRSRGGEGDGLPALGPAPAPVTVGTSASMLRAQAQAQDDADEDEEGGDGGGEAAAETSSLSSYDGGDRREAEDDDPFTG